MKNTKLVTAAAIMLFAQACVAQEVVHVWQNPSGWWSGHFAYEPAGPRYTSHELSLDAFANYTAAERKFSDLFDTDIRHGTWGGGLGLNYFLTREIGIAADAHAFANGGNFVDYVSGSLVVRLPFEKTGLAPYVFGGGGRTTQPVWSWTGHAGVGLEMRFNPVTGMFIDSRYIWGDKVRDAILFRAGFRLVF